MSTVEGTHSTPIRRRHTARLVQRGLLAAAVAAAFTGALAGSASANPPNDTTVAEVNVSTGITITGLTPSFTLSGAPGEVVNTGNAPVIYNISSNDPAGYRVTVTAAAPVMTSVSGVPPATHTFPIQDLTVRDGSTSAFDPSTFQPMTDARSGVVVHSQSVPSDRLGDDLSTDFQIRIPTVPLGLYQATLNYLATVAA
jgi:hypothetical protein